MVEKYKSNLKKLKLIYVDCGSKDEFNLQIGSRILHSKLSWMKIKHRYEEYEDGHKNIKIWFDGSLPLLFKDVDI